MNRFRLVFVVTLLLFAITLPLAVLAEENTEPSKNAVPGRLVSYFVYFPPEIKEKYSDQTFLVRLRVVVSEYGTVKEVNVKESSGYSDLDDVIVESAKDFIYTPAYSNGKPTGAAYLLPLKFTVPKPEQESADLSNS